MWVATCRKRVSNLHHLVEQSYCLATTHSIKHKTRVTATTKNNDSQLTHARASLLTKVASQLRKSHRVRSCKAVTHLPNLPNRNISALNYGWRQNIQPCFSVDLNHIICGDDIVCDVIFYLTTSCEVWVIWRCEIKNSNILIDTYFILSYCAYSELSIECDSKIKISLYFTVMSFNNIK